MPLGVYNVPQHHPEQACFIAISSCVEPQQTHVPSEKIFFLHERCLGISLTLLTLTPKTYLKQPSGTTLNNFIESKTIYFCHYLSERISVGKLLYGNQPAENTA